MKHSLRIALLAGAIGIIPGLVTAQSDEDRQQRHRAHQEHMREQFGVTDDQFQQMRDIRRNGGSREEAAAVLSESQRERMRQWRDDNPEKVRQMQQQRENHRAQRSGRVPSAP